MSLQNILKPNNFSVYLNDIETNKLTIVNSTDDTKFVELTTTSLAALDTNGKNILADGIQFNLNESILQHYLVDNNDYVIPFASSADVGSLTMNFVRIGQIIFCTVRNFIEFSATPQVSTVAIPAAYRPTHNQSVALPMYSSAPTTGDQGITYLGFLNTSGIFTFDKTVGDNGTGGEAYYIGINNDSSQRFCFSYVL